MRTQSFQSSMWLRKGQAALTRRKVRAAMLATAGLSAIGFGTAPTATPAHAQKGSPCHSVRQQVSSLKVTLNKSRTLCFPDPFSTAVIGAPEIADVLPMTESMLYVQGKKVGATNISVFDQQRRLVSVIDLDVTPDTTSLQNKIAASTGGGDINVTSVNGEIVLSGEASDGLAAARAVDVAKGLSQDAPVVNTGNATRLIWKKLADDNPSRPNQCLQLAKSDNRHFRDYPLAAQTRTHQNRRE